MSAAAKRISISDMFVADRRTLAFLASTFVGCASTPNAGPAGPTPSVAEPSRTPSSSEPAASASSSELPPAPAASASATAPRPGQILFVDSKRASCEGEGIRECLRVRETESEDWYLFYRTIEGFDYEPGTSYELRVSVERVVDGPADTASLRYRLLEIVSARRSP